MTSSKAQQLVKAFEDCTWPSAEWSHEAHFVMALWYIYHYPMAEAKALIKEGIKKYNVSQGGKNTEDSGYHETITELYIRLIALYQLQFSDPGDLEALLAQLKNQPFVQRDFPFQFYSKELLLSREARARWVEPDLKPLALLSFSAPV